MGNLLERVRLLGDLALSALTWIRHDTHRRSPVPENPKFMSAAQAVGLIRDGEVVADSGLGGNLRASVLYWAIREAFEASGHPRNLTVVSLGGHGGRGRVPGTLEELGRRGLCTRLITGHFETYRAMLELASKNECELQCLPQGTMALLLEALANGETSLVSTTGVGTFLDPRVGSGSCVGAVATEPLVTVEGDRLRYHLPPVDVAIFNAPAADRQGNIYVKHAPMVGEIAAIARAARRNGGRVIANVGLIVDEGYDRVYLPADMVDAIVFSPRTEQTAGVPHRRPWLALTTDCNVPIEDALAWARFVNRLLRITPRRTAVDETVARLAATTLLANVPERACVNIGVGIPEEVCRIIFEGSGLDRITFLVESGAVGGLPAPGIYFGAAFSPERIISSTEMFKLCCERLDATCLGALQVDGGGNVNASRRGPDVRQYVGPGGSIDLSTAARTVVFACSWMTGGAMTVDDAGVHVVRPGAPKFVEQVAEVTFNGSRALAVGKRVFYATPVGLFRLTQRGVELVGVMPGIDVRRDILDFTRMPVVLPAAGEVPRLPTSVLAGSQECLNPIPVTEAQRCAFAARE